MRMLIISIDLQLLDHCVTQRALREHTLNSDFKGATRETFLHLAKRRFDDATRVTRVTEITLVESLVTAHLHLGSVDDDDVVARINVRRKFRLVLTAEAESDFSSETTNDLVGCVNNVPFARNFERLSREGRSSFMTNPDRENRQP